MSDEARAALTSLLRARTGGAFTEDEYRADVKRVVEWAFVSGRSLVLRPDGSMRVMHSVPREGGEP